MATIGTSPTQLEFLRIDQGEQQPGENVQDITRPGVDGIALRKLGVRGDPFTLSGVADFVDDAAFQTFYGLLRAMRGTVQSWVNNEGTTLNNLAVVGVRLSSKRQVRSAVGGLQGANATLFARFDIQVVDTGTS